MTLAYLPPFPIDKKYINAGVWLCQHQNIAWLIQLREIFESISRHSSVDGSIVNKITSINSSLKSHQKMFDKNEQHLSLIDQVLSHYQQYYGEKSVAAQEDVFRFFSPPWFTSFERTFLWIGGFRPTLVFKLINNSVHDLTAEQERVLDQVKAETRKEERELAETMARVQESLPSPPLMNLARRAGNLIDGEGSELDSAMKDAQTGMLAALEAADALRGTTVRKVLHVLHPVQTVKLLAAAAQFHLRIRRLGLQRDELRTAATNCL